MLHTKNTGAKYPHQIQYDRHDRRHRPTRGKDTSSYTSFWTLQSRRGSKVIPTLGW